MSRRLTPIRLALLERDRTQKWLADELGVSEPVMSRIVNGLVPDASMCDRIAETLGRSIHELWPGHGTDSTITSVDADDAGRHEEETAA